MSPSQRSELVRILIAGGDHSFEELSKLNDKQIHLQWLAECLYIPADQAPLGLPECYSEISPEEINQHKDPAMGET